MDYIIESRQLSKSYGSKKVLQSIDIQVKAGQIIGYIGPNGAGKSTTVKILCGLDNRFEGDVFVNGVNIKEDPIAVKKVIGYIPELAELYDVLTPMEYLNMIGTLHGMEKKEIQEKSQTLLRHFGLENDLNKRMNTFSKGMRQKVLITSGLMHNPDIIFMDEPLTGLDANTVIMVKEIISKLAAEGKTIFYCSHIMDVVEKISDRIMLIANGQIIADGSFDELKGAHSDSLENLFAQLTGDQNQASRADDFLQSISE